MWLEKAFRCNSEHTFHDKLHLSNLKDLQNSGWYNTHRKSIDRTKVWWLRCLSLNLGTISSSISKVTAVFSYMAPVLTAFRKQGDSNKLHALSVIELTYMMIKLMFSKKTTTFVRTWQCHANIYVLTLNSVYL